MHRMITHREGINHRPDAESSPFPLCTGQKTPTHDQHDQVACHGGDDGEAASGGAVADVGEEEDEGEG